MKGNNEIRSRFMNHESWEGGRVNSQSVEYREHGKSMIISALFNIILQGSTEYQVIKAGVRIINR